MVVAPQNLAPVLVLVGTMVVVMGSVVASTSGCGCAEVGMTVAVLLPTVMGVTVVKMVMVFASVAVVVTVVG